MFESCEQKNLLCDILNISTEKLATLSELWRMTASTVDPASTRVTENNLNTKAMRAANTSTALASTSFSSNMQSNMSDSYEFDAEPSNSYFRSGCTKSVINSKPDNEIIDLGSPSPKRTQKESRDTFRTPKPFKQVVEQYDFFGAATSPSSFDASEEMEEDFEPFEPPSDFDSMNSYNRSQSSIIASPISNKKTNGSIKPSPLRLGSTSPGGKINPKKFPVGNFIGNVTNHGTTGEFDGYSFAHSKIMLTVNMLTISFYQ